MFAVFVLFEEYRWFNEVLQIPFEILWDCEHNLPWFKCDHPKGPIQNSESHRNKMVDHFNIFLTYFEILCRLKSLPLVPESSRTEFCPFGHRIVPCLVYDYGPHFFLLKSMSPENTFESWDFIFCKIVHLISFLVLHFIGDSGINSSSDIEVYSWFSQIQPNFLFANLPVKERFYLHCHSSSSFFFQAIYTLNKWKLRRETETQKNNQWVPKHIP